MRTARHSVVQAWLSSAPLLNLCIVFHSFFSTGMAFTCSPCPGQPWPDSSPIADMTRFFPFFCGITSGLVQTRPSQVLRAGNVIGSRLQLLIGLWVYVDVSATIVNLRWDPVVGQTGKTWSPNLFINCGRRAPAASTGHGNRQQTNIWREFGETNHSRVRMQNRCRWWQTNPEHHPENYGFSNQ